MASEKKANRPRLPREEWLSRRNSPSLGRVQRERSRFVHISQQFTPIIKEEHDDVGNVIARELVGWDPVYRMGKLPKGRTYKNPKRVNGRKVKDVA